MIFPLAEVAGILALAELCQKWPYEAWRLIAFPQCPAQDSASAIALWRRQVLRVIAQIPQDERSFYSHAMQLVARAFDVATWILSQSIGGLHSTIHKLYRQQSAKKKRFRPNH